MSILSSRTTRIAALGLLSSAVLLAGCENMSERQKGTLIGAAVGAVGGAAIAKGTGGKAGTGAVAGGVVGAVVGNVWSKRMEDKRKAMEAATKGTGVEVTRTQDNQLQVNVPSDISFDVGRANLRPELMPVLDKFAAGLSPSMQVRVVGHTDSTGSDAINEPLSVNRANSVRDYLAARGVAASRVATEGRGARQPIADNGSDAGRARNRRVEIFLSDTEAG